MIAVPVPERVAAAAVLLAAVWAIAPERNAVAPIHFTHRPVDFRLDSCETLRRHAPETMAGGVAVWKNAL